MVSLNITNIKNWLYIPIIFVGFPIHSTIILSYLVLIDIITGVLASARLRGAHTITSKRLKAGVISKAIILIIPLTLFLMAKGITNMDISFFISATVSGLMLAEAYSIIGNIQVIRTGADIKEYDAINLVIKAVRKGIETFIDKLNKKLF